GLGLEGQQQCVAEFVANRGAQIVAQVTEVESGRSNSRPELARALDLCRRHGATLLIAKLDRLARKVSFIADLMERDVPFIACDRPNASAFELHIFAAMAEQEAREISVRTKVALAAAKARGVKLGNPNGFGGKIYDNSAAVVR
ncbi:recombinase family protein, partial [Sphingobium sp. D43FB]|uniref:recombinase family protein n=1 Tax=Sphingobium sp. D43FB TaxID=2017595 RepID=UPI000BCCB037